MENTELTHYGVRGQKWGIRRYQNKDGTLTAAGKKRYAQELEKLKEEEKILKNKQRTKAQLDKLEAKRKAIEDQKRALDGKKVEEKKPEPEKPAANAHAAIGKKKVKDMTDEELRILTNRMQLEKNYNDAMKALAPEVNKGKKFTDNLKENAKQGVAEASKNLTNKATTYVATQIGTAIAKSIEANKKKK